MAVPEGQIYLVGGGIASLAAAVFLIRDAGCDGGDIHILEASEVPGGSLDGSGDLDSGYVIRGGRMFEEHFACTFDLLSEIPSLGNADVSVTEDIRSFTREIVTSSRSRLVIDGAAVDGPAFGLSARDRWDLVRLSQIPESRLRDRKIEDYFGDHFFASNFWHMWCTMFAFQTWHSLAEMRRYMRRFMHLMPGFNRLEGIFRTRLNQYDSIVRPLVLWLEERGVNFHFQAPVTNLRFDADASTVTEIEWLEQGQRISRKLSSTDRALVTLGSMTEGSSLGSMTEAPQYTPEVPDGAWQLWRSIAPASPGFGKPERFAGAPRKTLWESFTVTLGKPDFFDYMESFTGNPAGTGGLVTFKASGWLMSVVLAHQPHFAAQRPETFVFWGYGLHPHDPGDAVGKPMLECSGGEILDELAYQLDLGARADGFFEDAVCIPCLMPYITSQFMPRSAGDRPDNVPNGARNYAFLGQFCELDDDTVFTVEYSVRSAQRAVSRLFATDRSPPPVYRGFENPRVVTRALRTILRNGKAQPR